MLASPSPSSEGMLQELRRARTYVAFVQTDDQAGAFSLFFCHCADDIVVVVGADLMFCRKLREVRCVVISALLAICGSRGWRDASLGGRYCEYS